MEILKRFGLSDKEIRLYLTLLELGTASSGELIKRLGFYSKTVYEILEKLMNKGLVSYVIKANIKYFEAVDPEKFLDILKEEEHIIKQKEKELRKIIPQLKAKRKLSKEPQEATIYKGKKGMKSVFDDSLKQKKEILVFGSGGKFKETFELEYIIWQKKRLKKKIPLKILWNKKFISKLKEFKTPLMKIKVLPEIFDNPVPVMIYDNKIVIIIWSKQPIVFSVRSKEVAQSFKNYFEFLWKIAK